MRTITVAFSCLMLLSGAVAVLSNATNNAPPPPSLPPMPRYQEVTSSVRLRELSPIAYFRVLLGMTPAEREHALASKPAADRQAILRKITEYQAFPPDVREARLHQTELRWILVDLMKLPPTQRTDRLRGLDAAARQWVDARLRQWDQMPAAEQKAYLEKESFLSLYLRWQNASPISQSEIIRNLPLAHRGSWTNELVRWQALPVVARREMCERFKQFFAMDGRQQEATVSALSEEERRQMETSLRAFASLALPDRRRCVQSFSKFATMAPAEENQFLRNAARWENMAPAERHLWRRLVNSLPPLPPMPPGFYAAPAGGLPPMPPGFNSPPVPPAPKNFYAKSTTN